MRIKSKVILTLSLFGLSGCLMFPPTAKIEEKNSIIEVAISLAKQKNTSINNLLNNYKPKINDGAIIYEEHDVSYNITASEIREFNDYASYLCKSLGGEIDKESWCSNNKTPFFYTKIKKKSIKVIEKDNNSKNDEWLMYAKRNGFESKFDFYLKMPIKSIHDYSKTKEQKSIPKELQYDILIKKSEILKAMSKCSEKLNDNEMDRYFINFLQLRYSDKYNQIIKSEGLVLKYADEFIKDYVTPITYNYYVKYDKCPPSTLYNIKY